MRSATRAGWTDYSIHHEGFTPFPYCDTLNLVTTGIGNLIDSGPRNDYVVNDGVMAAAFKLPWKIRATGWTSKNPLAGGLVSIEQIRDAWTTCKLQDQRNPGFKLQGGFAYAKLTNITLDMDGIMALFNGKTNAVDSALSKRYPTYSDAPCDAQFGLLSMSWAMGDAFWPALLNSAKKPAFQAFKDAFDKNDFRACAAHSTFGGGGSLSDKTSRNAQLQIMFTNAAIVVETGSDRDQLYFPGSPNSAPAKPSAPVVISPATTPALRKVETAALATVAAGGVGAIGYTLYEWLKGRHRA